jgi:hypothetical protein
MGDRIVYTIKQDQDLSVNLYSHWGGYDRFLSLANAIAAAKPRWNDTSYATRIIVSQLIGDQWDEETGFGLWASNSHGAYGGDHPDIIIDLINKTVEDETGSHSFDSFISYHGSPVALAAIQA